MLQEGGVFSVVILDLAWHWEEIWEAGEPKTTGNVLKGGKQILDNAYKMRIDTLSFASFGN